MSSSELERLRKEVDQLKDDVSMMSGIIIQNAEFVTKEISNKAFPDGDMSAHLKYHKEHNKKQEERQEHLKKIKYQITASIIGAIITGLGVILFNHFK